MDVFHVFFYITAMHRNKIIYSFLDLTLYYTKAYEIFFMYLSASISRTNIHSVVLFYAKEVLHFNEDYYHFFPTNCCRFATGLNVASLHLSIS
jgi:hypothetical protein